MFNKIVSFVGSFVNNNVVEPLQSSNVKMGVLTMVALASVSLSSCKKDLANSGSFENRSTSAADYSTTGKVVVPVTTDITADTHWTAGNIYELSGIITVRNNATLTIDAGTFIKSTVNVAGSANGVLVIAKDGIINAVGESCNPIVFTSRYLLDGDAATAGTPGDFGGVIILGGAQINTAGGDALIEGLPNDPKFHYGSTGTEGNVGSTRNFKYVRIEYAGYKLAENIEVNGLTMGGVGSGTAIDHVQTSYGLDDGFEFFGGKVSPSYLIALGNDDDQYDFDAGYTGEVSFAIALADKTKTHSASSGNSDSNGMEIDNNATTPFTLMPKTHPILSNFSIIGTVDNAGVTAPGYKDGILVRRGAEIELYTSIVTGYPKGFVFDTNASATPSTLGDNSIHGFGAGNAIVVSGGGSYTDLGNVVSVSATAPTFGITQPFYNSASSVDLLFPSGDRGAITETPRWTDCWGKFVY